MRRHAALFVVLLFVMPISASPVDDDSSQGSEYTLVYELVLPDGAAYNENAIPYGEDHSAEIDFSFDRIAYHLELQRENETRIWVFVSFPALTLDPAELGVPTAASGAFFQQVIEDVNVESNHPNLTGLGTIDTGVIEFWGSNYGPGNGVDIPGANGTLYDFGDSPSGAAGYGSMQIHDHASGETLFAYNAWGYGEASDDLGIGNNPDSAGHPDWTFEENSPEYSLKTLRVLVRPGPSPAELALDLDAPQAHQVVQRDAHGNGIIEVSGSSVDQIDSVEGRHQPMDGGAWSEWTPLADALGGAFYGQWTLPEGWHRLELQTRFDGAVVTTRTIDGVGVGEVFIVAGQSNSANHGDAPLTPTDARVSTWGPGGWRFGHDPQPGATGTSGSPWPVLGDHLSSRYDVPIGFLSVGVGGTRVDRWVPDANDLFPRIENALDAVRPSGARAILWHQGESNAGGTTTEDYAEMLGDVVLGSRAHAGYEIPWIVARVGFTPSADPVKTSWVVGGQNAVIDADPLTFAGPLTDDLNGTDWRYDTIHFNEAGLREHAARWDVRIATAMQTLYVIDSDDDGLSDDVDACPNTPLGEPIYADGCSDSERDADGDGVSDAADRCPDSDDTIDVDADGIPDGCDELLDTDGDGVSDANDRCEGHDDTIDIDQDGYPDDCDILVDSDHDDVADEDDRCPGADDDIDVDQDGLPDGCDNLIDSDGDGRADQSDVCNGHDDRIDEDEDGVPDGCDDYIGVEAETQSDSILLQGGLAFAGLLLLTLLTMITIGLMRRDGSKETSSPTDFDSPPLDIPEGPDPSTEGVWNEGEEWLEMPEGSGTWYKRDQDTRRWALHLE